MPDDDDIAGDRGRAAEHAAFVAARHYLYGIQVPTAIRLYRHRDVRGPAPLPVPAPIPRSGTFQIAQQVQMQWTTDDDSTIASSPDMPSIAQRLQWQIEDNTPATPSTIALSYHTDFQNDRHAFLTPTQVANIYDTIPVLEDMDEEREEAQTTAPQPGVYPGPGWVRNINYSNNTPVYPEYVVDNDMELLAAYYQYDLETSEPELLLTRGRNCRVHSRPLHARASPYPRPMLTRKQEFTFYPGQEHSKLVDHALALEQDDTLRAEVIRYRSLSTKIHSMARRTAELRRDLFELQKRRHDSAIKLSEANAYHRLTPKILFDAPPAEEMTAYEVQQGRDNFDDPWADRPRLNEPTCAWCDCTSHDTVNCKALTLCRYCRHWGHDEDHCRNPHRACREDKACRVPRDHPRWSFSTCPSNVRVLEA